MILARGKFIFLCWLAAVSLRAAEGRLYDFNFKQMDIRKVILSIAALERRSVQFSQSVAPRNIDVSLRQVTAGFALKLITESYGYVHVLKGSVYHVMTQGERGPIASPMVIIPLKNVLVSDVEDNIRTFLGNVGVVSSNRSMNALVLSAPDEVIARIRPMVEALDQETDQVYIEAKIVETSTTFSRSLGIQWGPNVDSRTGDGISFSAPGTNDTLRVGFSTGILGSRLAARLSTGEQNGEVKIISQPKITTLNGVPANISSNVTFNIRTLAATGAAASSVGSVQQVKAGLQLQVTPYIVSATRVRLQISVTKSDPDDSSKIDGIPGITDNSASTSLIVDSGQIASIGGLVTNRASTAEQGVPFFKKLPIIGGLFGSTDKQNKETELMIFLVPSLYRASRKIEPFAVSHEEIGEASRFVRPESAVGVGAVPGAPPPPPEPPGFQKGFVAPVAPAAPAEPLALPKLELAPPPAAPTSAAPKAILSPDSLELAPKEGSLAPPAAKPTLVLPEKLPALKLELPQSQPKLDAVPQSVPQLKLDPSAATPGMPQLKLDPVAAPPGDSAPPVFQPPPELINTPLSLAPAPAGDGKSDAPTGLLLPQDSTLLPRTPQGAPPPANPTLQSVPQGDRTSDSLEGALLRMPTLQAPQNNPPPAASPPQNGADQALSELLGPIQPEAAPSAPASAKAPPP